MDGRDLRACCPNAGARTVRRPQRVVMGTTYEFSNNSQRVDPLRTWSVRGPGTFWIWATRP